MLTFKMNSVEISKEMAAPARVANFSKVTSNGTDTICSEKKSNNSITLKTQSKSEKDTIANQEPKFNAKTHSSFNKKADAISSIDSKNDTKFHLFSEDLSETNGSKKFIVSTYDNIYCMSKNKKCNMYENYEANQPVKLILDIDYKQPKGKKMDNGAFDDLLKRCIEVVNDKIKEHLEDVVPKIIIIKSCREEKMSAHIIYTNIHFMSILSQKCFMSTIRSPLIADKIIDLNIYKVSCMRMLWNSKLGKSNVLDYDNESCKYLRKTKYEYTTDQNLFMDCLVTNISGSSNLIKMEIDDYAGVDSKKPNSTKTKLNRKKLEWKNAHLTDLDEINKDYKDLMDISIIKQYLDILDAKRADDYNKWLDIGMCIFNCNSSKAAFMLWDEWSKRSASYDGRNMLLWKWRSFDTHRKKILSIGTLRFYAKKDNPDLYSKIQHVNYFVNNDEPNYEAITIRRNYLLGRLNNVCEKIKDKKSIVARNICKWIESSGENNIKTLAIKSPYNTGKTTLIRSIFNEFDPKKVLFITHRQSLTNELYGVFDEFGFCSYLNKGFDAQRFICQIESLHKITIVYDEYHYEDVKKIDEYDLVILDEIESLMYHFESPTVTDKNFNFNLMLELLKKSKKVLALDGDFHNRGYELVKELGAHIILHNTIKKDPKNILFTNNLKKFDEAIDADLVSGKKLVIVAMSANIATKYYERYRNKYKTIMHCGKSDDDLKELLKDVEGKWIGYELVIYSPSVQSGVSFDIPHFDKMYVILSKKSCSPRDLMQMCHRVRQFVNNDVLIHLNGIPYRESIHFHTFDEAKEHVKLIYSKYTYDRSRTDVENSLYAKILTHNELENLNKAPFFFVPMMIKFINEKGYTYSFDNSVNTKKGTDIIDFNKESIANADDIDKDCFNEFMKCQMNNTATTEMKNAIEKYLYHKTWKVDINVEFLDKWFRKTHVLDNLRQLKSNDIKEDDIITIDEFTKKRYLNYDKAKQVIRIEYVKDLVETMGFSLDNIGKNSMISRDEFDLNKVNCFETCKIFTDKNQSELLFDVKIGKLQTNKAFLGFVNKILQHYGLCVKSQETNARDAKTKKVCSSVNYYIKYIDNIDDYI